MNTQDQVRQFHEVFGAEIRSMPGVPTKTLVKLREVLMQEELDEFKEAAHSENLVAVADALADLVYVTYGTALSYGLDLDALVAEVHRSNMTKLGVDGKPVLRADGKVLKGPEYEPPRIADTIKNGADRA